MKFRIDKEIKGFLPPQQPDERQRLEKKIVEEGPLKGSIIVGDVSGDLILVDGHNTIEICHDNEIDEPQPKVIKFKDLSEVKQWMIDNQFSRRNLTNEQKHYFIGKEYLIEKKPDGRPEKPGQNDQVSEETATKIGEKHNVSPKTVRRDAEFAKAVDTLKPEAKAAVLNGEKTQTKAQISTGIFCRDCRIHKPKENCKDCEELRRLKSEQKKPHPLDPQPSKNGKVKFDDRKIHDMIGKLTRLFNERAEAFGHQKSKEWKDIRDNIESLINSFEAWQKRTS